MAKSGLRNAPMSTPATLDVEMFALMDATASMTPYIDAVRTQTKELFGSLVLRYPGIGLSCGFYREHTCASPFSFFGRGEATEGEFAQATGLSRLNSFLEKEGFVEGNTTSVEALGAGIYYASQLPWSAPHRVLVCVGDHASHGFASSYVPEHEGDVDSIDLCELGMTHERILNCLSAAGLRCYMVRCGNNSDAERQYRDIANRTGGRFIDFKDVTSVRDLVVVVQAALADATGGDARKLIEGKRRAGELGAGGVRALLESFDDKSRGRSDA